MMDHLFLHHSTVPELDAGVTDAIVGTAAKKRRIMAAGAFQ